MARPFPAHDGSSDMTQQFAVLLVLAMLAPVLPASAQTPGAPTGVTPALVSLLQEIRGADKGQLAVSEEDGRFLRLMIASSGAKHALEIGAASGYSAIWIGLGLRETGGRLTTIEYDSQGRRGYRFRFPRRVEARL